MIRCRSGHQQRARKHEYATQIDGVLGPILDRQLYRWIAGTEMKVRPRDTCVLKYVSTKPILCEISGKLLQKILVESSLRACFLACNCWFYFINCWCACTRLCIFKFYLFRTMIRSTRALLTLLFMVIIPPLIHQTLINYAIANDSYYIIIWNRVENQVKNFNQIFERI